MATRNLVYFVSSRPLRFRAPVPADDMENGARHSALDKYFRGRSATAPPGRPRPPFLQRPWRTWRECST